MFRRMRALAHNPMAHNDKAAAEAKAKANPGGKARRTHYPWHDESDAPN